MTSEPVRRLHPSLAAACGSINFGFDLTTADELGIRQASNLIDELKADEPTASPSTRGHANGNGAYATTGGAR